MKVPSIYQGYVTSIIVVPEPPSSFCEANDLVGVICSSSLLLISFNYFVENTPINTNTLNQDNYVLGLISLKKKKSLRPWTLGQLDLLNYNNSP